MTAVDLPAVPRVLIAAANSAGHHGTAVQTLPAALHKLAAGQSMNLILGLALKHSVVLGDPALVAYAERHWQLSQDTADYARRLARLLELDHERCYSAGMLHRLGDLALLRCLEDWRLPLELRQLIAAIYSLEGGVYARDALVVNLAAQMARLNEHEGLETLAAGKTARLLKVGLAELTSVRKN